MADIKQAAKWMQEGHHVRRAYWSPLVTLKTFDHLTHVDFHSYGKRSKGFYLNVNDLLADDWEIVQDAPKGTTT